MWLALDYSLPGKVEINVDFYIETMMQEYEMHHALKGKALSLLNHKLFKTIKAKRLSKEKAKIFHAFVAKAPCVCKRARPDMLSIVLHL